MQTYGLPMSVISAARMIHEAAKQKTDKKDEKEVDDKDGAAPDGDADVDDKEVSDKDQDNKGTPDPDEDGDEDAIDPKKMKGGKTAVDLHPKTIENVKEEEEEEVSDEWEKLPGVPRRFKMGASKAIVHGNDMAKHGIPHVTSPDQYGKVVSFLHKKTGAHMNVYQTDYNHKTGEHLVSIRSLNGTAKAEHIRALAKHLNGKLLESVLSDDERAKLDELAAELGITEAKDDSRSENWLMRHVPGDKESEAKLAEFKKTHKLQLKARLGKNNPHREKYMPGGSLAPKSPYMRTSTSDRPSQNIKPEHAQYFDVYSRGQRKKEVKEDIEYDYALDASTIVTEEVKKPAEPKDPAVLMQLHKVIASNGTHRVQHQNGELSRMTPNLAKHAIGLFTSLKTPEEQKVFADKLHGSHASMRQTLGH